MYQTKNDLPEEMRAQVVGLLNRRLADAVDLQIQAKVAHWNVKGPTFSSLHELFDEVALKVKAYVDLIAERVVQLGGVAEATVKVVAERSELDDYPLTIADGQAHVEALSGSLAAFGRRVRLAIDETAELGDATTADVVTEVSRGVDKLLWFVEAHAWKG